jgi:hypothetical protein
MYYYEDNITELGVKVDLDFIFESFSAELVAFVVEGVVSACVVSVCLKRWVLVCWKRKKWQKEGIDASKFHPNSLARCISLIRAKRFDFKGNSASEPLGRRVLRGGGGRTKFVGFGGECGHLAFPLASKHIWERNLERAYVANRILCTYDDFVVIHVAKAAGTEVAVAADCEVASYVVG